MLTRWEPFGNVRRRRGDVWSELNGMQQEMNRLFDDFFGERKSELGESAWLPAVDVSETENEIIVKAELPGMTQENIDLNLQDNILTLKGEKKQESKEENENFHRVERSYGSFTRTFTLPSGVKEEDIKANFKDGVLMITLPKAEEAKPKKIAISTGS
ncbi:Hsp20 family protein [candidate division KSB3 bacterium]|uniref:Hsp20 family protein n=1 Tax=candidate division KSB3 bacterium TaxID=2044937 RepID=A0A9D5JT95_9BACT|nr:Hsp20 family protein [candidate division KSB3 bacterium]MBD3323798.1 Hsp20 family protein [candidate division KSB3 bacterium]